MSASYYDLMQRHADVAGLHAHNVCSYLRGRLNARVVERLAPETGTGSGGLARFRIVRRVPSNDAGAVLEWTGTLPEICREYGLDIGRVVEQCR